MDPKLLSIGQSILIKRSDGRVHAAAISGIDSEKCFVAVEWFENNETKGKEIDFESVYTMNKDLFKLPKITNKGPQGSQESPVPAQSQKSAKFNNRPGANRFGGHDRRTVVTPKAKMLPPPNSHIRAMDIMQGGGGMGGDKSPPEKRSQKAASGLPARVHDRLAGGRGSGHTVGEEQEKEPGDKDQIVAAKNAGVSKSRKSNCVKEVERLKKNRDERRAKQAEQLALRNEEYDTSIPNWEFLQKINEFLSRLPMNPLSGDEPVVLSKICVCVRKRPLNKKELSRKEIDVVTVPDKCSILLHEPKTKVDLTKYLENQNFTFDCSFDENVPNEIVYKYTAQPLVQTVFDRGMATCFAYGQTGSGKTHTMGGVFTGKEQDATNGIYAMAAADIFALNSAPVNVKKNLIVSSSFFEIYSGKVYDLLNKKERLRILEDKKQQVQIVGLEEEVVEGVDDVLRLIQKGNKCRTSGTTSANQHSSRSHAVFQIIIRRKGSRQVYGKFSLIDLAGNERGADTATSDRRTRMEGAEINRSLLALKECIRALGKKGAHLPFRGSKLTLVLKDSFVGENSRTCMIAMISPGFNSCEHTLNTLRYADRVKELRGGGGGVAVGEIPQHQQLEHAHEEEESGGGADDNIMGSPPHMQADLQYLHRSLHKDSGGEIDLDQSSEILTFHTAIDNLVESEEHLVTEHKAIIQADQYLLEEEKQLLEYVDDVNHDIEQYVVHVERIISQKVERLSKFKERIQDLKQRLQEEETASRKVKRLPMI